MPGLGGGTGGVPVGCKHIHDDYLIMGNNEGSEILLTLSLDDNMGTTATLRESSTF